MSTAMFILELTLSETSTPGLLAAYLQLTIFHPYNWMVLQELSITWTKCLVDCYLHSRQYKLPRAQTKLQNKNSLSSMQQTLTDMFFRRFACLISSSSSSSSLSYRDDNMELSINTIASQTHFKFIQFGNKFIPNKCKEFHNKIWSHFSRTATSTTF